MTPHFSTSAGDVFLGTNDFVLPELSRVQTNRESVALIYMDPPFFTGREHRVNGSNEVAFDDRWDSFEAYLQSLMCCVRSSYMMLASWGSVVIHVDSKISHYVKYECDRWFGGDQFVSEIIWRYRRWPTKTRNFQRVHDVLLRYAINPEKCRFNQLYEPLAPSTVATWGVKKQRAVVSEGKRLRSSKTESNSLGVPMGDVWDIGIVAPVARERTGYPTQKPEALMERLILALTDPGDLVLDPYAGSGTTLAVAARLGRRFVGIDSSKVAMRMMKKRLG